MRSILFQVLLVKGRTFKHVLCKMTIWWDAIRCSNSLLETSLESVRCQVTSVHLPLSANLSILSIEARDYLELSESICIPSNNWRIILGGEAVVITSQLRIFTVDVTMQTLWSEQLHLKCYNSNTLKNPQNFPATRSTLNEVSGDLVWFSTTS